MTILVPYLRSFVAWLWDFRPGRKHRRILRQMVEVSATIYAVNWILENSEDFAAAVRKITDTYREVIKEQHGTERS